MKRWPLVASFILFIALCISIAFWAMQLFKPPLRPVAAPPKAVEAPPRIEAAAGLFGGRSSTAVASNFQLMGVLVSGTAADSVAILAADGKPAQAVRANTEIMPGIRVKEVHRHYVVLLDNGVEKRVELPDEPDKLTGAQGAARSPVAASRPLPPRSAPAAPSTVVSDQPSAAPPAMPQNTPGAAPNAAGNPVSPPQPNQPPVVNANSPQAGSGMATPAPVPSSAPAAGMAVPPGTQTQAPQAPAQ